jgi:hypothetical protein
MNGSVITWANTTPAGSESLALGDDRIRSLKTSVQAALDDEHVFPSSGGTAGQHRAGSARAYFGTQSRVSASTTSAPTADGRMMLTSDTTRLFGVGSEGTAFLGGAMGLSIGSFAPLTFPQRSHLVAEMGIASPDGASRFVVTFPNSGFSERPFIFLQSFATYAPGGLIPSLWSATPSGFSAAVYQDSGGTATLSDIMWVAIGRRAL